jgi:two-component system chemotaxis response regulator CheB
MPVTVLVVDDSAFFRQRVSTILNADPRISVVGTAENGRTAIEQAQKLRPDVITMDYEMPIMNGISALVEIMRRCPTPVLMFSSLTYEGARITLEALESGAVDYLPKSYEQVTPGKGSLDGVLIERVLAVSKTRLGSLAGRQSASPLSSSAVASPVQFRSKPPAVPVNRSIPGSVVAPAQRRTRPGISLRNRCSLVVFGTSTGGPVAIQAILKALPANFPVPVLIVQHMPKAFTGAFAERLNDLCRIQVREAQDGDRLQAGLALLAPGGMQMMVENRSGGRVRILPGDDRLNYKPSVDITFGSAANHFPGKVLGIVLTGMGADGREGARLLKNSGSTVWAQSEKTCVIYGMPQAIVQAQLADQIIDLDDVGQSLITALNG